MLQIEEWFRRPQRKPERKPVPMKPATVKRDDLKVAKDTVEAAIEDCTEDIFEPEESVTNEECAKEAQENVELQDSVAEAEELEHISQEMGQDVSEMIDLNKEDLLLQQIDEFREKARQLQNLMTNRKSEVEKLQSIVSERKAKADDLDELIHVRQHEADKIMGTVSDKIEKMSQGVSQDMNEISATVTREMSGLSQNLTQNITYEINQASEKTREAFEKATQNAIDQNTRSLEGLKEQIEQLSKREHLEEISTEMSDKISTLKSDISDKIHSEDVKCYRNIQASMDEQSKLLAEGDEKTRQHLKEQFEQLEQLEQKVKRQGVWMKLMFGLSVISVAGIVAMLLIQMNIF